MTATQEAISKAKTGSRMGTFVQYARWLHRFHLQVLPGSPGLVIHAHGIFLPFEPIVRNSWSRSAGLEEIVTCCRLTYRHRRLGNELAFVLLVTALPRDRGNCHSPRNGLLWRLQDLGC
jgi:hypothetical protein